MPENLIEKQIKDEKNIDLVSDKKSKYDFKIPDENAPQEEKDAFFRAMGVPENAKEYKIEIKEKLLASDPEVNEKLRKLGFTPKQVQAVYDLAAEKVIPLLKPMACEYEGEHQLYRLVNHFGGEERWSEVSRQIAAWGQQNVPKDIYEILSSTYDGVITLYNMMNSDEPPFGRPDGHLDLDSEENLKHIMKSEKYWREKDPETLRRVTEGFKRLYPEK